MIAFLPQRVTEQFYRDVLADTQLRPYFTGVDLGRLKIHLSALLAQAVHSPGPYHIEDLVAAHHGLGLSEDDYDRIGHYLLTRLLREQVGPDVLLRVGTMLTEARGPILGEASHIAHWMAARDCPVEDVLVRHLGCP
jgi:hemoglobin